MPPQAMNLRKAKPAGKPGFTLVELLSVLAIVMLLAAFLVPAFADLGKAGLLNTEGNRVANLADFGRENSMARNAMTALVVLTDPALEARGRTFALFELVPPADGSAPTSSDWKQISGWEVLRPGVVADQCSFAEPPAQPAFPPMRYGGSTVNGCRCVVFLPSGSLMQSGSAEIRLVEGFFPDGSATPVLTHPSSSGPANYYRISILNATGRVKIDRP